MDDHDLPASQGTEIRHQLTELRSKVSTLPVLLPNASPTTVKKRADLLEYIEVSVADISEELTRFKGRAGDQPEESIPARQTRLKELLPEINESPLTALAYKTSILAYPEQGSLSKVEDRGITRLLRGFEDSEEAWVSAIFEGMLTRH